MPGVSTMEAATFRSEYDQGTSISVIAKRHGRSVETVHRWLKKTGDTRSSGEGVALKMALGRMPKPPVHRVHDLDEEVFERDLVPETAWLLGLIFADGCVRERRSLLIACGRDRDLAEKASVTLGSSKPTFEQRNCWMVEVGSKRLAESLMLRGAMPGKTYTMTFPRIPNELLSHFVRGAWEGDGTVYRLKGQKPMAKYVTASERFARRLSQVVAKEVGLHEAKVSKSKRDRSFSVAYGGSSAVAVVGWMYSCSEPHMRCDRKHRIACDFGRI